MSLPEPTACAQESCTGDVYWVLIRVEDPAEGTGSLVGSCRDHFEDLKAGMIAEKFLGDEHFRQPHRYGGSRRVRTRMGGQAEAT